MDYLIIGAGEGVLDQARDRPYWWQQPQYAHVEHERTSAMTFGGGWKFDSRSLELTYRQIGPYSGFVAFQDGPEDGTAVPSTNRTQWAYNYGIVRGFAVAGVQHFDFAHISIGAYAFHSDWRLYRSDNVVQGKYPDFQVSDQDKGRTFWTAHSTKTAVKPIIGFGFDFDRWALDFDAIPETGADKPACCSPWRWSWSIQVIHRQ